KKEGCRLTAKQKRFCDEYLIDCNATRAAIRAGYNEKTAYSQGQRMLKNVELRAYIDAELEQLHSQLTADAREVMEYLTAVMRGKLTEQVLIGIGEGVQKVGNIEVSAKDRLKAAELIGKRYGLFKEGLELTGAVPVVIAGEAALED
ncbi:MAG: terminase small subunit, partial [Clostridium sp.]|nr:terminase small subunit [Clostridium sp.]